MKFTGPAVMAMSVFPALALWLLMQTDFLLHLASQLFRDVIHAIVSH